MKKDSFIIVGVVVAIAVSVAGLFFGDTQIVNPTNVVTGASPSAFITENNYGVGGVAKFATRVPLNGTAASTTVCVIPAPKNATSTLTRLTYAANSATGTAMDLVAYKSASPWIATTALTDRVTLAANTNERVVATTSVITTTLFNAGDYVVVRSLVAGGGAGASSPNYGACQVEFTLL